MAMQDHLLGRIWADNHDAFSEDAARRIDLVRARFSGGGSDPLPLVARAMALVLAVSLTGLTMSVAGY